MTVKVLESTMIIERISSLKVPSLGKSSVSFYLRNPMTADDLELLSCVVLENGQVI